MSFDRLPFWVLLIAIWILWLAIPHRTARKLLLIGASFALYVTFDPSRHFTYFALLLGFTVGSFVFARALRKSRNQSLLWLGVALGIGMLVYTKGWMDPLPVGISFYSLQAVALMVDVYRTDYRGSMNLLDHSLYMSFFPRLAAGPIVRPEEFLPQLEKPSTATSLAVWEACVRVIVGLFLKLVIADNIALAIGPIYDDLPHASGAKLLLAAYGFTVQIYCDFAGYTNIALGMARLFGYTLPENFNWPYLALNPADFWRRWHITLSQWLRDYIYFSLPGLRSKSNAPAYLNVVLTMLICGLWHGVAWTFVLWGLYHGILLASYRAFQTRRIALPAIPALIVMQFLIVVSWIIFRANRVADLAAFAQNLGSPSSLQGFNQIEALAAVLIAATVIIHVVATITDASRVDLASRLRAHPWSPWSLIALLALLCLIGVFSLPEQQTFLYFRF